MASPLHPLTAGAPPGSAARSARVQVQCETERWGGERGEAQGEEAQGPAAWKARESERKMEGKLATSTTIQGLSLSLFSLRCALSLSLSVSVSSLSTHRTPFCRWRAVTQAAVVCGEETGQRSKQQSPASLSFPPSLSLSHHIAIPSCQRALSPPLFLNSLPNAPATAALRPLRRFSAWVSRNRTRGWDIFSLHVALPRSTLLRKHTHPHPPLAGRSEARQGKVSKARQGEARRAPGRDGEAAAARRRAR